MKHHSIILIATLIATTTWPNTYAAYDTQQNVLKEIDAAYARLMPATANVVATGTQGADAWQTMLTKINVYISTLTDPHKATLISISKQNMDLFKKAQAEIERISNELINAIKNIGSLQFVPAAADPTATTAQNSEKLKARKKILDALLATKKTIAPLQTELKKRGTFDKKETGYIKDIYGKLLSKLSDGIDKINMDFSKTPIEPSKQPPASAPQEPGTTWAGKYKNNTEAQAAIDDAYKRLITQNKLTVNRAPTGVLEWQTMVKNLIAYATMLADPKRSLLITISQKNMDIFKAAQQQFEEGSKELITAITNAPLFLKETGAATDDQKLSELIKMRDQFIARSSKIKSVLEKLKEISGSLKDTNALKQIFIYALTKLNDGMMNNVIVELNAGIKKADENATINFINNPSSELSAIVTKATNYIKTLSDPRRGLLIAVPKRTMDVFAEAQKHLIEGNRALKNQPAQQLNARTADITQMLAKLNSITDSQTYSDSIKKVLILALTRLNDEIKRTSSPQADQSTQRTYRTSYTPKSQAPSF